MTETQESDLLNIKKKLRLPDIRLDASKMKECQLSGMEIPDILAVKNVCNCRNGRPSESDLRGPGAKSVTDVVIEAIAAQ